MSENSLNAALKHFEATEANLVKAEKILDDVFSEIPSGIAFSDDSSKYDSACSDFVEVWHSLPLIDGWKPDIHFLELNEIAQNRLDAHEIQEVSCMVEIETNISEPRKILSSYKYHFDKKRRALIRDSLNGLIDEIDANLRCLKKHLAEDYTPNVSVEDNEFEKLKQNVAQIETLLGSSVAKPTRWKDLHRHLAFGLLGDLHDIIEHDWPSVKAGLRKTMYGEKEPIPVGIKDLGELVSSKPKGPVSTKLKWDSLDEEEFERLIFALISNADGYENPEWLMRTNAPDRGRDMSVYRVHTDALGGTQRERVIIQCKHWLSKSVSVSDIASLKEQMKLWEPPRVDVHVIVTSGRFSSDAVQSVEKHNQSDTALKIEMWPESHLERLLASRPALIGEFSLR